MFVMAHTIFVSQPDPLDLVLGEPIFRAIIKLGRARAFMRGHRLRVLERAAIAEIGDLRRSSFPRP